MDSSQKRKSFETEHSIRCFNARLEHLLATGKRVLDDIVWKKTRIATVDSEIFYTSRAITERLLLVRQSRRNIISDKKNIVLLNVRKCELNREKSTLLANKESHALETTRICTVDKELFDIDINIAKLKATIQRTETEVTFNQQAVAGARKLTDELRRQKAELLAFLNEIDDKILPAKVTAPNKTTVVNEMADKLHRIEAITISEKTTPPTGQHDE